MKKSVKLLSIIFIMIFLIPIASYADGRVRFNYGFSSSNNNPELGSKTVSSYHQGDGTTKSTGADKLDSQSFSSFSIHYVSDYGLDFLGGGEILLGMYQFDKSYKTKINTTSVWVIGATPMAASGEHLATRTASGTSRSLDVGYVYPIGDMSVGGGIALPILGSSGGSEVAWTAKGSMISGHTTGAQYAAGTTTVEKLDPEGKSFTCFFLNFGYSIGSYEVLGEYRSVSSSTAAPLSKTKGVGALLNKDELTSDGETTTISLGVGYRF